MDPSTHMLCIQFCPKTGCDNDLPQTFYRDTASNVGGALRLVPMWVGTDSWCGKPGDQCRLSRSQHRSARSTYLLGCRSGCIACVGAHATVINWLVLTNLLGPHPKLTGRDWYHPTFVHVPAFDWPIQF